ncbi:MAG: sigma-70 family RNA polymerase sigma factor [Hyphomicrobiales bacterium]|nr:sigma-70 family RNA polymerase sigma factor [Hyphomicrobiales bacterium]
MTEPPHEAAPELLPDEHKALMARVCADQDRDAFANLFDYFGPRIKAVMLKGGADHALAEDIVQDVMMTVWRKVELYAPERGSVATWIFTIARNARIDRIRRGSSQPYEDIDDFELMSADKDAEEEAFSSQQAVRVARAIAGLPDEQRKIIELAYVNDMPQSQIAADLTLPLGTVKSRMRLAYAKLRTELEDVT